MTRQRAQPDAAGVVTIYCPQCGKRMRVAPDHIEAEVACPHCSEHIDPWRYAQIRRRPKKVQESEFEAPLALSHRSRVVAGLLGIFLGGFGVHRFYLGYFGIGFIQLILFPITFGCSYIWGLIEGILCLTGDFNDADGRILRD